MNTRQIRNFWEKASGFIIRYLYAVFSCLYLFTVGFFRVGHRAFISQICGHFGLEEWLSGRRLIPKIAVSAVVPEGVLIRIHEMAGVDGNVSLLELVVIDALVISRRPKALFEIGTFDGRTTLNMASNADPDAVVTTLDLPRDGMTSTKLPLAPGDKTFIAKEASGTRFMGKDVGRKIVALSGDSATFDLAAYFHAMDFVFIDGSHSYDYVLNDSHLALRLLREGKGIIVWHDYGAWKGVTEALNELYLKDDDFRGLGRIEGTSLVVLIKEDHEDR